MSPSASDTRPALRRAPRVALPVLLSLMFLAATTSTAGAQGTLHVRDGRAVRDSIASRRAAWAAGAHLALGTRDQRARLRYGIDWFGTPATPSVHSTPAVFVGMSDDVRAEIPGVRGRVAIVMISSGNVESMMDGALRVRDVVGASGAAGVMFLLSPSFDERDVRDAATEIESATDELLAFADASDELPTMFVRYGAFVGAARLLGIDITKLTMSVVGGVEAGATPFVIVESELPAAPLEVAPRMRVEGVGGYAGAHQN